MNFDTKEASDDANFDAIESVAATWVARCDRGLTPDEVVEFAIWRSADRRHEAAVADLSAMWSALDDLSLSEANVSATPAPVVSIADDEGAEEAVPSRGRRWFLQRWALPIAACLTLGAGIFAWQRLAPAATSFAHYETVVGAQQTITLPDGSTLQLNTNSAADVRYAAGERRIELMRGEAFFSVTKDPQRPFIVTAGGVESRALGTKFVVRQREHDTELVVTEGRVRFGAAADRGVSAEVDAGQFGVCNPQKADGLRVDVLDESAMLRRLAWKTGRLVCRFNMPLAEAAAEFNRYHHVQLVMLDAETAAAPIGGAFELENFEAFVQSLESSRDITVVKRDPGRVVLKLKR